MKFYYTINLVSCVLVLQVVFAVAVTQKESPIVGVLSSPFDSGDCIQVSGSKRRERFTDGTTPHISGCIWSLYVSWIQMSAMRVVPIPYDANTTVLDALYESLNVIMFTGGELDLKSSYTYYRTASYLYHKAVQEYQERGGETSIVLWGTCQGFQLLATLAANDFQVLHCTLNGVDGVTLPLNLTESAFSSRLFEAASDDVLFQLQHENTTTNLHHCGVFPSDFSNTNNSNLSSTFNILSTNVDSNGVEFVSTMEGRSGIPFFGVQWHPERPPFEFTPHVSNNPNAVAVSQYMSDVLARLARKNDHKFPTPEAAEAALLIHYPSMYYGHGVSVYFV